MALFCAATRKDSISLFRYSFFSYVHVSACVMSLVCHLKRPYSCFSSHFCFLSIVILSIFVLSILFLVAEIRIPPRFSMLSSSRCIDASTLSSMLASLLLLLFLTHYYYFTPSLFFTPVLIGGLSLEPE